jgi:hypothetical protein
MFKVTVEIVDTETGEVKNFVHEYDEPPMLIAVENPSVELGLSMGEPGYDEWVKRFDGSEFNLLNRHMGQS